MNTGVGLPTNRPPAHPGKILRGYYLEPNGITQTELAAAIDVPIQRVNELVNGRRGITPDTALRLEKYFPTTNAGFWMNLQSNYDLWYANQKAATAIDSIPAYNANHGV
jgi:addiction module HigA family antidote